MTDKPKDLLERLKTAEAWDREHEYYDGADLLKDAIERIEALEEAAIEKDIKEYEDYEQGMDDEAEEYAMEESE